jgi:hypothetical protein
MFYVDRITRLETTDRTYRADRNFDIKRYSLHPLALFIEAVPLPVEVEVDPDREESLLDFLSGAPQSLNVQHDPDSEQGPLRVGFQTTNPTAFFSWMIRHPGAVLRIGPAGTHARFLEHLSALKSNYADLSAGGTT